jgi:putative ABC transport system substrate-binding protein
MHSDRRRFRLASAVLAAAIACLGDPALAAPSRPTVAILKSSTLAPFELATEALTQSLRRVVPQPEVLTFDLDGDAARAPAVLRTLYAADPQVIVTIGSLATSAALADPSPIPIVFSMVLYPKASGFQSTAQRGVTGVSLDLPLEMQFASLRRLLPRAKKVGVLYHPAETGAIAAAAVEAATRSGLTLVTREVGDAGEAVAALGSLMEEVDAVWAIADGHVFTPQTTPALILAALRRRVPLIGLSTAHVRSGALAALSCDYRDVGAQTGDVVQRVLRGERAETIPVTPPRRSDLAVNQRTAELLGVTIPPDGAREAETLP